MSGGLGPASCGSLEKWPYFPWSSWFGGWRGRRPRGTVSVVGSETGMPGRVPDTVLQFELFVQTRNKTPHQNRMAHGAWPSKASRQIRYGSHADQPAIHYCTTVYNAAPTMAHQSSESASAHSSKHDPDLRPRLPSTRFCPLISFRLMCGRPNQAGLGRFGRTAGWRLQRGSRDAEGKREA